MVSSPWVSLTPEPQLSLAEVTLSTVIPLSDDPLFARYRSLSEALVGLVEDYSLVSFCTLDVQVGGWGAGLADGGLGILTHCLHYSLIWPLVVSLSLSLVVSLVVSH